MQSFGTGTLTLLCMACPHWPSAPSSQSRDKFPKLGKSLLPSLPAVWGLVENAKILWETSFAILKKALLASAYPEWAMEVAPPGISKPFIPANT